MAGSLGGSIPQVRMDRPSVVSLVVNNKCNLSCGHCYLQPDGDQNVPAGGWRRLLTSILGELRPDALCFSGKEIFADAESAELFLDAVQLRNEIQPDRSTKVGGLTNGTLVHRFRRQLANRKPDWLDVSFEGLRALHDAIRGTGSFDRTAANIPWLLELMASDLWITTTVLESNIDSLPEAVSGLNRQFGLQRFSFGLYRPQAYTAPELTIRSDAGARLVRSLLRLGECVTTAPIDVRLELDSSCEGLRVALEQNGLLPRHGVVRKSSHALANGVTLHLATTMVPVGLWRAVRVTHEGQWLAAEDLVDAKSYAARAVGNVADFDFDARRLYQAGLHHRRFAELYGVTAESFLQDLAHAA